MATAKSFAQHFVECGNCEENPAQFFCKTCRGHLCETCKTEHETRKITKHHEVMHLHSNRENTLCLLYCEKHTVELEWYCSPCRVPMCAKCHIESHNGHKMEELAKVYKKIRGKLKEKKEQIEVELLPTYREMLSEEETKRSGILERTDEVQKQIEKHTKSIIDKVKMIKDRALHKLCQEELKALESVEETECEIKKRIEILEKINESIINNLGANPGITFFKNTDSDLLLDMQKFPSTYNYQLSNFQHGDLSITKRDFGNSPKFTIFKENNLHTKEFLKKNKEKEEALAMKIKDLEQELGSETQRRGRIKINQQIVQYKEELSELKRLF